MWFSVTGRCGRHHTVATPWCWLAFMSSYIKCMWAHILLLLSCPAGRPFAPGHGAKIKSALKENPPGGSWEKGQFCFFKATVDQHTSYKFPSALHFSFFQLIVLLWFSFAAQNFSAKTQNMPHANSHNADRQTRRLAVEHWSIITYDNFVGFYQCCITACFNQVVKNHCDLKEKCDIVGEKKKNCLYFLQLSAN